MSGKDSRSGAAPRHGFSRTVFHRDAEVPRSPCAAMKDPRAGAGATVPGAGRWTDRLKVIPAATAEDFAACARALCPHDWLADGAYQAVVLAIDAEADTAGWLVGAYRGIAPAPAHRLSDSSAEAVTLWLSGIEDSDFFRRLLSRTVFHLYDSPLVWSGCGYEGVAGRGEGVQCRGIDDLDWLPDPQQA